MVTKLTSLLFPTSSPESVQQGAHEEAKCCKKLEGRDLAHEVMKLRAEERGRELSGLSRSGTPHLKREQFKSCVHKRVFEIVSKDFHLAPGEELDEVTEEVTDQIVTAADHDPIYRRIFDPYRDT